MATWDLSRLDALAGDLDSAVARSLRSLDLAKGDPPRPVSSRCGWASCIFAAASWTRRRLALKRGWRSLVTVQRDQEAVTRLGLGDVMLARGDRQGARKRYESAAAALEKGAQQSRCIAEQRLARMELEDGGLDQAHTRFETMLGIAVERHSPLCEAEARAGLADVEARRGNWEKADAEARRVVELTETFREAAVSLESRSLGFGALAPAYERAIDISMQRAEWGSTDVLARALALNEQARARGCSIAFWKNGSMRTYRCPPRSPLSVTRYANGGVRASQSCKLPYASGPLRRRRRRSLGKLQRSRWRCGTWKRGSMPLTDDMRRS